MWGSYPYIARERSKIIETADKEIWNPNLRSTIDVDGHHIQAEDGEIGHVDDFVIEDDTWAIRYLIINTANWWLGKRVLISPRWIKSQLGREEGVHKSSSRNNKAITCLHRGIASVPRLRNCIAPAL